MARINFTALRGNIRMRYVTVLIKKSTATVSLTALYIVLTFGVKNRRLFLFLWEESLERWQTFSSTAFYLIGICFSFLQERFGVTLTWMKPDENRHLVCTVASSCFFIIPDKLIFLLHSSFTTHGDSSYKWFNSQWCLNVFAA